jgi:MFS superfamily sulfate permease-like transporter
MMGLANIVTGLAYRLPMPIEPMKVLAVVAIAQRWSPSQVYASAFGMGIVWTVLAITGVMGWIALKTPKSVVRGIQVALGALLAVTAFKMISTGWVLGLVAMIIVVVLRQNRYAPAAIVLMGLGIVIVLVTGGFQGIHPPSFQLPPLTGFRFQEVWQTMLLAGFAQIPVTATNAIIATASLIAAYWPERAVSERKLSFSTGSMNLIVPFFGGMPMCHGAGGLAGQYYFGARTGGTNLIEGVLEIGMGLFLAYSIADLFGAFPQAIIGAMMLLVGIELVKVATDVRWGWDLVPLATTVLVALATNMAFGFLAGLAVHYGLRFILDKQGSQGSETKAGQDSR